MYESSAIAPTSREIARDARVFVRSHLEWVWEAAKPVMPYILPLELAGAVLEGYFPQPGAASPPDPLAAAAVLGRIVLGLASSYFWVCLALSWHRVVLLGPRRENIVSPFALPPGSGSFFLAFYLIAFLPVLFGILGGVVLGIASVFKVNALIVVGAILALMLIALGVYKSFQFSFLLPARSVGVALTRAGAKKISKGLLWRLFAGVFRACWRQSLLLFLVVFVLAILVGGVSRVLEIEEGPAFDAVLTLLALVPTVYFQAIISVLSVTVLSFLYQWSAQNRFKAEIREGEDASPHNNVLTP